MTPRFETAIQNIRSVDEQKIITVKYQHGEVLTSVDGELTELEFFGELEEGSYNSYTRTDESQSYLSFRVVLGDK